MHIITEPSTFHIKATLDTMFGEKYQDFSKYLNLYRLEGDIIREE